VPSGREIHNPAPYAPPGLDEDALAKMRVPVEEEGGGFEGRGEREEDSSEEEGGGGRGVIVGASPGTAGYY
jgi:hypothetical protein